MDTLWQDIRFGVRTLTKAPVFTAAAVLSLGLGIGANSTVFTIINSVFLNPLPVDTPSELIAVYTTDERNRGATPLGTVLPVSYLNYKDFREKNEVLLDLAAYTFAQPVSLSTGGEPEQVFGEMVTGNYFDVLGVRPAVGRVFLPEEDRAQGTHPVVVIGYGLWQRRFGADPHTVGRPVNLNGFPYTIIGIAPEGFRGVNSLFGPDLWVPSMMSQQFLPAQLRRWLDERRALVFTVAGRLKPGVTLQQAEANLKTVAAALEREYPAPNKGRSISVRRLTEATVFPGIREVLLLGTAILMAVVALVLLIACSNVANLLLARAEARRQEIAVRLALGAGRGRLVRQLVTESLVLGLAGGAAGIPVAFWGRDLLVSFRPAFVAQNLVSPQIDARVLAFTVIVSIVTGVLFGIVPALQASRPDMVDALKEETRTAGRSRRGLTIGNALVVGQVAFSLIALAAAGFFLRSIQSAYAIDPGFETGKLAVLTVAPGQAGYDQPRAESYYREARDRVVTIAGVRAASWATNLPLFGGLLRSVFVEGREDEKEGGILTLVNTVDVDYFATSGIPLLRGRAFTEADREGSAPVAIINDTMATRYWPNQDPIGRRFRFYTDRFYREVVGVARTAKYTTLGEAAQSCVYVPFRQNFADAAVLYVRSEGDPAAILSTVQRELQSLDARMPINNVFTVAQVIDQSLWAAKLGAGLLGAFGLLALMLASVGLYGVMAYAVNQRRREIGVRMALGADRSAVLTLVLGRGMTLVAIGVAIGLAGAAAASRAAASLLFGEATGPASFVGATVVLVAVAFVASYVPAYRASRMDPVAALREA